MAYAKKDKIPEHQTKTNCPVTRSTEIFTIDNAKDLIKNYNFNIDPESFAYKLNDLVVGNAQLYKAIKDKKALEKDKKTVIHNIGSKSKDLLKEIETLERYGHKVVGLYKVDENSDDIYEVLEQTKKSLRKLITKTHVAEENYKRKTNHTDLFLIGAFTEIKGNSLYLELEKTDQKSIVKYKSKTAKEEIIEATITNDEIDKVSFNEIVAAIKAKNLGSISTKQKNDLLKIVLKRGHIQKNKVGVNKSIKPIHSILADLIVLFQKFTNTIATAYYDDLKECYDTPFVNFAIDCCKIIKEKNNFLDSTISPFAIGEKAAAIISKNRNRQQNF